MKLRIALLFTYFFTICTAYAAENNPLYFICINGETQKTSLEILDRKGNLISSEFAKGINLHILDQKTAARRIRKLFQKISPHVKSHSLTVAGISGVSPENREALTQIFSSLGIIHLELANSADLALELVKDKEITLISQIGSICFAQGGNKQFKIGGLGPHLGDEGSEYFIGKEGLKAAISQESSWGERTSLTYAMHNFFEIDNLYSLIKRFSQDPDFFFEVASLAPIVFEHAKQGDRIAQKILSQATLELGKMVAKASEKIEFPPNIQLSLIGTIFDRKEFVDQLLLSPPMREVQKKCRLSCNTISSKNLASLVVKNRLQIKNPQDGAIK